MDDIAGRAGVAVGTLYRHFPTKAALVEAVVADSIDQLADAADAALARIADGSPAINELGDLFRIVAARHAIDAAVKEAAVSLGAHAPGADGRMEFGDGTPESRAWAAMVGLLDAARAEGSIQPDLTPLDLLALVSGVPREPIPADVRDRYVEIVLAGVRAVGDSPA